MFFGIFVVIIIIGGFVLYYRHKRTKTRKEENRDTCEHCIHLYYNNDGSVSCDSIFETVCLKGNVRSFKELM